MKYLIQILFIFFILTIPKIIWGDNWYSFDTTGIPSAQNIHLTLAYPTLFIPTEPPSYLFEDGDAVKIFMYNDYNNAVNTVLQLSIFTEAKDIFSFFKRKKQPENPCLVPDSELLSYMHNSLQFLEQYPKIAQFSPIFTAISAKKF